MDGLSGSYSASSSATATSGGDKSSTTFGNVTFGAQPGNGGNSSIMLYIIAGLAALVVGFVTHKKLNP